MKLAEHHHRHRSWVNTLYVALTPGQLAELVKTEWRDLSPAFADQRHLYLKLTRDYAELIARHWHAAQYGAGYVARLRVRRSSLQRFPLQSIAYDAHREYRVPVTELPALNRQIVGRIQIVAAFAPPRPPTHDMPQQLLSLH